ncbi:MAG: hypothetical protein RR585_04195 [Coprobacillus sp.]
MNKCLKYPLDIQLFADGDGDGDGGNGEVIETVPKSQFDKLASDYAKAKKELSGKKTEDEQRIELEKQKDEELESLKQFRTESTIKNSLLESGISKEHINGITKAYLSGDVEQMSKAIADMYSKEFTELQKTIDELKVTQIDTPQGGNKTKEVTIEDFKKMTIDEKNIVINIVKGCFENV